MGVEGVLPRHTGRLSIHKRAARWSSLAVREKSGAKNLTPRLALWNLPLHHLPLPLAPRLASPHRHGEKSFTSNGLGIELTR